MITIEQMDFDEKEAFRKNLSQRPDVKSVFPMISHPLFQNSILEISKIVEESIDKGVILNLRPFGEFRAFGSLEAALLVFPEFQRQGIGSLW